VADLGGEVVLGLELLEEGGEEEGGEEEDDGPEEHVGDVGAGQRPAPAHTRLGGREIGISCKAPSVFAQLTS